MIRKILKSVREYKKESLLTPTFMLGEVLMETLIPLFMAMLLDKGIETGNINNVLLYGVILVICALFSLQFGMMAGKMASKAANGFAKNLRHDLYYKVQDYSFRNIDKYSTSSIITRLTTDVTNVQNSYQMCIRIAVRAPLMFLFSLIMAFTINKQISLVFLIVVPVLFALLILIAKIAHPYFEKVFKTYDEINNVVKENVGGIRVVKSYVREDHEIKKFNKVSERIYKLFSKAEKLVAMNGALMDIAIYFSIVFIAYFGARSIVVGNMTTGELTSLFSYSMGILASLMMLSMIYVMIIISLPSMKRVVELLDEESDIYSPKNAIKEVKDGSIIFKEVNFSYVKNLKKTNLKNLNFDIKSGETIGIIGGTGSGKSSLVNLIPRLYDTTSGSVIVAGNDVKNYDLETLRNEVAMVLQKNVLFSGTIEDNLKWGNEKATKKEMIEALKLAEAYDFVQSFPGGLNYKIEQGATNVSGGQKQRLCIARALLKNPKIIIFDDSTSACDTLTDAKIRKNLKNFMPNVTKLIIAQRISSVEDADRVMVLDNGKLVDFDTPKKLLKTSKIYKEINDSQKKGGPK